MKKLLRQKIMHIILIIYFSPYLAQAHIYNLHVLVAQIYLLCNIWYCKTRLFWQTRQLVEFKMVRKYQKSPGSRSYRAYTEADLLRAVRAVQREGMSQAKARRRWNIPEKLSKISYLEDMNNLQVIRLSSVPKRSVQYWWP